MQISAMLLEKGMNFHTRLKPKQLPNLGLRKALCPIALHSQRLERDSGEILTVRDELGSDLIGNVNGNPHT